MKRAVKISLLMAVLILLALPVGLWLKYAEPYEKQIDHGPAPEAQKNPYLAAEHFLRLQKINVTSAKQLHPKVEISSMGSTLLALGSRRNLSPKQTQQLLDWAAQGGHLLVAAESLWDEDSHSSKDLLLNALDIRLLPSSSLEKAPAATADAHEKLTQLYLENESAPAYFDFNTKRHLEDHGNRAYAWANSGKATHMLQLEHGQGLITVLSDAELWRNSNIDKYDHAWLLWYLSQDSNVHLIYGHDLSESLWTLLTRHFSPALITLSLLFAALIWHVGLRQGPQLARPPIKRRQLQEHLRASADFALRRVGQRTLVSHLQQDIQRQARRRHPGFERLPIAQQWQALGQLSRLPSSTISAAMRPQLNEHLSASDFTRQVANLQTLRNAL